MLKIRSVLFLAVLIMTGSFAFSQEAATDESNAPEAAAPAAPVEAAPAPVAAPAKKATVHTKKVKKEVVTEDQQQDEVVPETPVRRTRFSVLVYGSFANEIKFNDFKYQGSSGTATFNTENVPGIAVEIGDTAPNSWGWDAGIGYDFERKLKSVSVSIAGGTLSGNYVDTKLTVVNLYGNAIYQWNQLYLPFGINVSAPSLKSDNDTANTKVTGGVGVQVGLGSHFTDNFAGELMIRTLGMKVTDDSGADFGNGYLTGFQINLKYTF